VGAALKLAESHAAFRERARKLDPEAFTWAYREFLTSMQDEL
jgi:hypothetical protein